MQDIDAETIEADNLSPFPTIPDLPEGWHIGRLGELWDRNILSIKNGYAQGGFNEDGQGVPHLRPFNVTNNGLIDLSQVKSVEPPSPASSYWMRYGDVIFNNTNTEELVGKTAFFDLKGDFVLSNHMTIIRVSESQEEIEAFWLSRYLHYLWLRGLFHDICRRHVNQASVGLQKLRDLILVLPPLAEQRAIAHALRTVQAAREARRREAALERERKDALMQRLFTQGTRGEPTKTTEIGEMPVSWEVIELGEVCTTVAFGPRFSGSLYDATGNVATLRTTDIDDDGNINYATMPLASLDLARFGTHLLQPRDLVITRSGTCGIVAVFEDFDRPVLPGAFLIRFRLSGKVDPYFLRFYLNSPVARPRVMRMAAGAIQQNISGTSLRRFHVPILNISEQRTIAEVLRACDEKIAALEREAAAHDELFKALLKELMTGRLRATRLIER